MTGPDPIMDSRKRSRMVALFLVAVAVGFVLHWAGYRLISGDREELSRFRVPRRRLSKADWNAYLERKRRLQEHGGLDDKSVEQMLNGIAPRGKRRVEEDADVLVPEVVHWRSFRRRSRLGHDHENRTRWRSQLDNAKERRGRIREHREMEKKRRFEMKSEEDGEKQEEEVRKNTKAPLKDKEAEIDYKEEETPKRETFKPAGGMKFIRSRALPTFSVDKLAETQRPALLPASLDEDEDKESTPKLSFNVGETQDLQDTPGVDHVRSRKIKPMRVAKRLSLKIRRSTEPSVSLTSELKSSYQAMSIEDKQKKETSKVSMNEDQNRDEQETPQSIFGITNGEVRNFNMGQMIKGSPQKIWRSAKSTIPSTSEVKSSNQAAPLDDDLYDVRSFLRNEGSGKSEDLKSTSKVSINEDEEDKTRDEQETQKQTSVIPKTEEVSSSKMKAMITKGSRQEILRSTEASIPSTSEVKSSTQTTSSEDEQNKPTTVSSSGEDAHAQNPQQNSKGSKSSDDVQVETTSSNPEANRGPDSSETNSASEIPLLSKPTFSWLMSNESICKLDGSKNDTRLLVILVLSTRHGYGSRQAIRHTWGSIKKYNNWQIRTVFLLGDTPSSTQNEEEEVLTKKLQKEQDKHGDLITGNFMDTPKNLTVKHLMGLKWILEFCQNVNFVMKVDDNIFLNTMAFVDARNNEIEQPVDLYCHLRKNVKAEEDPAENEKSVEKMYPDFCHRWAYGASLPSIKKLYAVSGKVGLKSKILTDDVFVTGILRKAALKEYNWEPKIGIITDYTSLDSVEKGYGQQMAFIRDLCKKREWDKTWPVNAVTYLKREEEDQGKLLERDMKCVWGKVLYDRKGRNEKKSRNL